MDSYENYSKSHATVCFNLSAKCIFCNTKGLKEPDIAKHAIECAKILVSCNLCGENVVRDKTYFHQKNDCPKFEI